MKLHLLVTIAVLFLSLCLTLGMIAQADVVEIPDPNLRAALESALGKNEGDAIVDTELQTLKTLAADHSNITDLRTIVISLIF